EFVRPGLMLCCLLGAGCRQPTEQPKVPSAKPSTGPNIVFILTDDQAPNTLGIEGNPHVRTPHLDRLAQRGVLFSRAYVPIPLCAPSRAAILTGLYPHQNGVIANKPYPRLSESAVTFPQLLKQNGYACALVGKWHLGDEHRPQLGFEDLWVSPARQSKPRYNDPALWVNGRELQHTGQLTSILTDYAVRFVEDHAERPFLLWLAYQAPHGPLGPPAGWLAQFRPKDLPLPESVSDDLSSKPRPQRNGHPHSLFLETPPNELKKQLASYYAHIACLDHNVGRLVRRLEELNLLDKTLVIFMSDNGFMNGEHQMFGKGANFYEEQVRTPLIMHWPGHVGPNTRIDALVSSLDLFPTLCALTGTPAHDGLAGIDLWPLVSGRVSSLREALFFEYEETIRSEPVPMRGVVTKRYKYVAYVRDGEELYDLQSDPHETRNLVEDPDLTGVADSLRQRLTAWQAETEDHLKRGAAN
ncbi:MAG: sulfatase-like hydrolase/transferase, partial [Phycisphaerales bacterium]